MAMSENPIDSGSTPLDPLKKKLRPDADVAGYTAPLGPPSGGGAPRPPPLQTGPLGQLNKTLGAYNQAGQQADDLQSRMQRIQIPAPFVSERGARPINLPRPGTNAAVLAHQTIGARVNAERGAQSALAPKLDSLSSLVRGQTAQLHAQSTQQGANALLSGVGVSGIPAAQASPVVAPPKMTIFDASNPSNFNVRPPSANVSPVASLASQSSPGGSGTAGGVPAPSTIGPLTGGGAGPAQPGFQSVASGVNAQGNNIYDNASIAKLNERMAAPGSGGGVSAQAFGGLSLPTQSMSLSGQASPGMTLVGTKDGNPVYRDQNGDHHIDEPNPLPNLPLPTARSSTAGLLAAPPALTTATPGLPLPRPANAAAYNVRQADQNTGKIASALEDAAFRTGLRASRGSRSAADAQASILQTLAQLGGQRLGVAAGIAGGDRDATAGNDRTALGETGANQRAALADTGETERTGMRAASDERVAQLGTLAELNRPTQVTDADGHLLRVSGATSAPIQGADGQPVRVPLEGAITPALALASLSQQLAAEANSLQPNAARVGMLQQQIDALMRPAANSAPSGPSPYAVQVLKADPSLAAAFDQKYGKGAAARYLPR